jgi:hypothetical protein
VHGKHLAGRRQGEEQRLAVGGQLNRFKEACIIELLGVSFRIAEVQTRIRLQTGGRQQILLRILWRALKTNRLGRKFFLRQQGKRTKQKQSYTDRARQFSHMYRD